MENGQGDGEDFPPVWGDKSYNNGAGLANDLKLATWLQANMPLDDETLNNQETADIAVYVNSKGRPGFTLKDRLPGAGKMGVYNGKIK